MVGCVLVRIFAVICILEVVGAAAAQQSPSLDELLWDYLSAETHDSYEVANSDIEQIFKHNPDDAMTLAAMSVQQLQVTNERAHIMLLTRLLTRHTSIEVRSILLLKLNQQISQGAISALLVRFRECNLELPPVDHVTEEAMLNRLEALVIERNTPQSIVEQALAAMASMGTAGLDRLMLLRQGEATKSLPIFGKFNATLQFTRDRRALPILRAEIDGANTSTEQRESAIYAVTMLFGHFRHEGVPVDAQEFTLLKNSIRACVVGPKANGDDSLFATALTCLMRMGALENDPVLRQITEQSLNADSGTIRNATLQVLLEASFDWAESLTPIIQNLQTLDSDPRVRDTAQALLDRIEGGA